MQPPIDLNSVPSASAMDGIMAELNHALKKIPETQQRLMSLTGVAWSDNRMVKAVVGPRGQLVDLEIDPRIFRQPDAQVLRASILAATTAAVAKVTEQAQEIMVGQLPPELAELRAQFAPERPDPVAEILMTDAQIVAGRRSEDG